MTTERQIFIAQKGSPIAFKVVPHTTDPTMLVIKAKHPEVGALIAHAAGIEGSALNTAKGSLYFMTFVQKTQLEQGLGKVILDVLAGNLALATPSQENVVPVYNDLSSAMDGPDDDDEEEDDDVEEDDDGDDDGDDY
jgi:hypothetical protein